MKYLKQFAVIFALVVLMIGLMNIATPSADAYYSNEYNFRYKAQSELTNGYRVQILGVGIMKHSGLSVFSSINAEVKIVNAKKSKSKLKSVRLIHSTSGYGINKIDITQPFKNLNSDMAATCALSSCYLQNQQELKGIILSPNLSLRAEIVFDTGTFTVWTSQEKRQQ